MQTADVAARHGLREGRGTVVVGDDEILAMLVAPHRVEKGEAERVESAGDAEMSRVKQK